MMGVFSGITRVATFKRTVFPISGVLPFARQRFSTRCASRLVKRFRQLASRQGNRWPRTTGCGGSSGAPRGCIPFPRRNPDPSISSASSSTTARIVGTGLNVCAFDVVATGGPVWRRPILRAHGPVHGVSVLCSIPPTQVAQRHRPCQ